MFVILTWLHQEEVFGAYHLGGYWFSLMRSIDDVLQEMPL